MAQHSSFKYLLVLQCRDEDNDNASVSTGGTDGITDASTGVSTGASTGAITSASVKTSTTTKTMNILLSIYDFIVYILCTTM